jgi:hypothetical protein
MFYGSMFRWFDGSMVRWMSERCRWEPQQEWEAEQLREFAKAVHLAS